jgi:putative membrane protein
MNTRQNTEGRYFFVAAIFAAALSGCSTSRQQPAAASSSASAAASPAARPAALAAKAKPEATHAAPSAEVSTKSSSAAILSQIHQADMKEIAIGEMAEGKASTSEVQAYANQLVDDHTSADQQVVTMARKMNVHLRDTAAKERRQRSMAEQKLKSASGPAFDRFFLQQTSADHERLIKALKQEREDASDDDIEGLIDKILPIFEQHKELTQILIKKVDRLIQVWLKNSTL